MSLHTTIELGVNPVDTPTNQIQTLLFESIEKGIQILESCQGLSFQNSRSFRGIVNAVPSNGVRVKVWACRRRGQQGTQARKNSIRVCRITHLSKK